MEDCVFCKIVSGDIPTNMVHEDDRVVVILDIHPINPGHMLVIPKVHEPYFYRLDDEMYAHTMQVTKTLADKIDTVMQPKRVGLTIAGFDVPHTHVHIIPMHDYHDITSKVYIEGTKVNPTQEELTAVLEKFRNS